MLMQVDPETFALNLMLILGGLIFLAIVFGTVVIVWTGINISIWLLRWRRRQNEFLELSRRADGHPYPPFTEGVCEACGRGDRKIYYPPMGKAMCPACYEEAWPCAEFLAKQNELAEAPTSPVTVPQ